jgi:uncharacterized membrane protein
MATELATTQASEEPGTQPPPAPAPSAKGPGGGSRVLRRLPRFDWTGVVGALLFGSASFTPSLLPRGWLLQGLIAGISAALGYAVGVFVSWFVRAVTDRRPSPAFRRRAWQVLGILGTVLVVVALVAGERWQKDVHALMGMEPPSRYRGPGILLVALLLFVLLVLTGRGLRRLTRVVIRLLDRLLPDRIARPIAVVAVGALVVFLLNGVLFRGLVDALNSAFSVKDDGTEQGAVRPEAPERSGSPASLVPWDELGLQGRNFVGTGPTREELTEFSGRPALEPVRVYAGLTASEDAEERAAVAVQDLQRAGGFDRSVLVVITTTGTGWVDPAASNSLEYEFNGDTAMVGLQYSYLPSWLSFLVDQVKAQDAGRALFDAVYGVWVNLPADERPELYVFGESLGTFGGESAFSGMADIVNRTDGVLWAGPPNFNDLWRELVAEREADSPEWLPVKDDGITVRWADEPADIGAPAGPWDRPRVLYLQNASDPIVWWSPQLIFSRPDWLRGERGPDVSQDMPWIPLVTFWQVTADMPFAVGVPAGHGHVYTADYVDGWAQVTRPPAWTAADTERLRDVIRGE